jgi:hypothetical protein
MSILQTLSLLQLLTPGAQRPPNPQGTSLAPGTPQPITPSDQTQLSPPGPNQPVPEGFQLAPKLGSDGTPLPAPVTAKPPGPRPYLPPDTGLKSPIVYLLPYEPDKPAAGSAPSDP